MNISNIIETYIKNEIGNELLLQISRVDVANCFNVAPSQINYVLSTRFTPSQGYMVESKRGGCGYIIIYKIQEDKEAFLLSLQKELDKCQYLSANKLNAILSRMIRDDIITKNEGAIIAVSLSDKALDVLENDVCVLRKNIFETLMYELLKK